MSLLSIDDLFILPAGVRVERDPVTNMILLDFEAVERRIQDTFYYLPRRTGRSAGYELLREMFREKAEEQVASYEQATDWNHRHVPVPGKPKPDSSVTLKLDGTKASFFSLMAASRVIK